MDEKRREAAGAQASANGDSPASEPSSARRRGGSHKRKASNLGSSPSSATPSKRVTREKVLLSQPSGHNGPLTRARQVPNSLNPASSSTAKPVVPSKRPDPAGEALAELVKRQREVEALEACMEAEFEAIRSRGANAHVVPNHCGWFSWTKVHSIEEQMLPSFFNGNSETRTPDLYMEVRNCIMKKFHADPSTFIELKDLLDLEVGVFDARQDVMEFLDHWGLINFQPFPEVGSSVASLDADVASEKDSSVNMLYKFEALQSRSSLVPKTTIATPTVPSGLFPESSSIADDLAVPEGPSVEYHCNSCSADCSRKRFHCQKQADYDLCSDCFNNGKFDPGMSSSDFILMEPAEAPGVSGGNWTDQETLLLLEALELFKENWTEIAEHVATKTKAQCILHFVQMPIEDTFLDYEEDLDASAKETVNPTSTDNDLSAPIDVPETTESRTGGNESDPQTSPMETSNEVTEEKVGEDTSKDDVNEVKVGQETPKLEDTSDLKVVPEADENFALNALKEAFEFVGYPPTPEGRVSFAEVGNPAMTLAAFLAHLVGPDFSIASIHNSLKSLSASCPGTELATRHCFLLEDPPNDSKEQVGLDSVPAEGEAQNDKVHGDKIQKEDNSSSGLEDKNLSNDNNGKKLEKSSPKEKSQSASEQDDLVSSHEEAGTDNVNRSENSELPKHQSPKAAGESDDSKVESSHPPGFEKSAVETPAGKPCEPTEIQKDLDVSDSKFEASCPPGFEKNSGEGIPVGKSSETKEIPKDVIMSDSLTLTKNKPQEPVMSDLFVETSHSTDAVKDVDASNSLDSEISEAQKPVTAKSSELAQSTEVPKDVEMACESQPTQKNDSQPLRKNDPQQPVVSNSISENGTAGEPQSEDGRRAKDEIKDTKVDLKTDRLKDAAVSAVAAAAVKAKLLAEHEEDQIRKLAAMLIEKQMHKLDSKLGFFSDMENVVTRVKEQLDRSRQKLYHERAQIIAARLGLPGSSSRGMPSAMPANRMAMIANSVQRPPVSMSSQRPPTSRPMGAAAPTHPNQFSSTAFAGSSIRPPS